ncbi:UDP-glucose--hexose-1-phosphate uridylyltransferase [Caldifermentibacillus hisashii]|uniref:UDP-glucose--hexose-1-phosphate uridylyltransferase n=1 Tax=Caldifermentibacillus hisashii TaxID=996558 RepID=UPI003425E12D
MIDQTIQQLINEAIHQAIIDPMDEIYVRNQILSLLNLDDFQVQDTSKLAKDVPVDPDLIIPELLEKIVQYAVKNGIIEYYLDAKEIFSAKIMNCFLASPSVVNQRFYEKYENSPVAATDYFYQLSKNSNYIQMNRIKKNIVFKAPTEYGNLDITINLSKPEKDPKQIAKERSAPQKGGYPTCLLCIENEGYAGRIGHPARSNHRMIRMNIRGEDWYLQYSPYVYYNEHCILLSKTHRNMFISRETFGRLLDFVERFPHYFLGSNADLPIVGGSILSHDHYQGGHYEFPMAVAEEEYAFSVQGFSNVTCSILKWPMSVIRLRSSKKDDVIELSDRILEKWKTYSDPVAEIIAFTGSTPHNTITPIARIRDGQYEMDLVLRNNRTSEEHPLGIFHPHKEVHHIKKENIGLIEVMGLAVLPARLKNELVEVGKFLCNQPNEIADYHLPWAEQLKQKYDGEINEQNVKKIVKVEVGNKFLQVLMDAGVFKRDTKGKAAFQRFIETLNK